MNLVQRRRRRNRSKTLCIDVSNRINYTLSKFFGWSPSAIAFCCCVSKRAFRLKCFETLNQSNLQMAPQSARFSTHQKRQNPIKPYRAHSAGLLPCKLLAIDAWIYLRNESEFAERKPNSKQKQQQTSWILEFSADACSRGSIHSDVMITRYLSRPFSCLMHFMWWYLSSHTRCTDSRHLQTGKLYEEIEIIIGSDVFVVHMRTYCTHTHTHKLQTMHTKSCQTTWKTRLSPKTHKCHSMYRKPLKMIFKFLKGCDWVCLLNSLRWWQSVRIWNSAIDSSKFEKRTDQRRATSTERSRNYWLQWW